MKRLSFVLFAIALFTSACTKNNDYPPRVDMDVVILAVIDNGDTRVSYCETSSGGTVSLSQKWEYDDYLIGYCSSKRFMYIVKEVSDGVAYLTWVAGDRLVATESDVHMYYAPGCSYTDISSGKLALDISEQDASGAMKAPMAACSSFSQGALSLTFSNLASILRIDRLCGLPAGASVSAVKVYGANSRATLSGQMLGDITSSPITLTKPGGWTTNEYGEVTDTLRIAILPSSSAANLTVKAVVEGTEYTVYQVTTTVASGKYYYPATIGARMVSSGKATYYSDFAKALAAANAATDDAFLTLYTDYGDNGEERSFSNASGKKITLDLGNCTLRGKNSISSKTEFLASGSGCAINDANVILVTPGGEFTITGSSLTSTSTSASADASPLAVAGSETNDASATVNGTVIVGNTTYGAGYVKYGLLTVNGDASLTSKRGFFITSNGSLTVNDGTITATSSSYQCVHIGGAASVITLNGGTFSSQQNLFNFNSQNVADNATLSITGGRFSWKGTFSGSYNGAKAAITGGLFSQAPSYGIPSGYECVSNTDPQTMSIYPYKVAVQ